MKAIKEIMKTAPLSCGKSETLQSVVNQMYKANIGFLPVVDENKKVIGTITDRDVFMALGKTNKTPKDLKVQEVMNKTAHLIGQDDTVVTALQVMRTKHVSRLPVVDSESRLKGVVNLARIARNVKDSSEKNELGHAGSENILNTFISLAERNSNKQYIED
jgi:predicted transcriptional regulator